MAKCVSTVHFTIAQYSTWHYKSNEVVNMPEQQEDAKKCHVQQKVKSTRGKTSENTCAKRHLVTGVNKNHANNNI